MIAEFNGRHALAKPLVILDTLGKVKAPKRRNEDAYQADYALGTRLKNLADMVPGSTLLVVHHTRKAEALDFVDSVSQARRASPAASISSWCWTASGSPMRPCCRSPAAT